MRVPKGSSTARVAAFYHRPFDVPFHGGSLHFKGFVERLRNTVSVSVVAPRPAANESLTGLRQSNAHLVGFRYLVTSAFEAIRFIARDGPKSRATRARVLVAFDVYAAGLTSIWAKIRRIHLVYYPQDSNEEVSRFWREAGYRGGLLFSWVRWPLERMGLSTADLILVVSPQMQKSLEAKGVPASLVRICPLKRGVPQYRASDVENWRDKLGLKGRLGVVFVGSFQYVPNVQAYEFVKTKLAPRLMQSDPNILVVVAGLDSEPYVPDSSSNLRVLGTVRDLDGLLFACQVGLAPMDVAGGTSGKIIDYVLHGLKAIATPEAARGVEPTPGLAVVPRDRFADQICELAATLSASSEGAGPPTIDPNYLSRYVDGKDIDRVGQEIERLAAA